MPSKQSRHTDFQNTFRLLADTYAHLKSVSHYNVARLAASAEEFYRELKRITLVLTAELDDEMLAFLSGEAKNIHLLIDSINAYSDKVTILRNLLISAHARVLELEGQSNLDSKEKVLLQYLRGFPDVLAADFEAPFLPAVLYGNATTRLVLPDYNTFIHGFLCRERPCVSAYGNGHYVVSWGSGNTARYLHSDGVWRTQVFEEERYVGYYATRAEAEHALKIIAGTS